MGGMGGGNIEEQIDMAPYLAAIAPGQGHGFHADFFGLGKGGNDICRITAGGDPQGQILFLTQSPDLFGKDVIIGEIIADTG
jgi:hypothetical protein